MVARAKPMPKSPDPSFLIGPVALGKMAGRSRYWAWRLLREWRDEQERGGPLRVLVRASGRLCTTVAVANLHFGRPDRALERRVKTLEADLDRAFTRIGDLERKIGLRR